MYCFCFVNLIAIAACLKFQKTNHRIDALTEVAGGLY